MIAHNTPPHGDTPSHLKYLQAIERPGNVGLEVKSQGYMEVMMARATQPHVDTPYGYSLKPKYNNAETTHRKHKFHWPWSKD